MLRRTRMQKRPPRRQLRDAVFGPYVAYIHGLPCVVCDETVSIQGSHVGLGGVGLKNGDACDMVPMCGPHFTPRSTVSQATMGCHAEWEQHKGLFSETDRGTRALLAIRWRLETWERFLRWCAAGGLDDDEHLDCQKAIRERISLMEAA